MKKNFIIYKLIIYNKLKSKIKNILINKINIYQNISLNL